MANKKITLPSGKELVIQIASFEIGITTCQAVASNLLKVDLNIGEVFQTNTDNLLKDPNLVNSLIKAILHSFTDKEVLEVFWGCANSCTYDGLRITKDLFSNDMDARSDFLVVAFNVLKENIASFFPKSLRSGFDTLSK